MSRGPLLGLVAVGTAGAAIGLARRRGGARREVVGDVTAGDLSGAAPLADRSSAPAALGTGHVVAPGWEPAALTALARWVPGRAATPAGRAVAALWAAPLSLAGWLLAVVSAARPRRRDGVWIAAPARGLFARWFAGRGFVACTLGQVIVAAREPAGELLAHEMVHVRQAERLGPLMGPLYVGLMTVYGYARHPMERAARAGARR